MLCHINLLQIVLCASVKLVVSDLDMHKAQTWFYKNNYYPLASGKRKRSSLDAAPTLAKLSVLRAAGGKKIQIIKRLAPNWRGLGILLDFDETGTQLDVIEKAHPMDPVGCCQAMFQHWVKGNGVRPCSWNTLIELLDDCDQQALAKEIQEALQ